MLLGVATDPFSQQVVSYINCPQRNPNSQGTLLRSSSYLNQAPHEGADHIEVGKSMAVAINTGLMSLLVNISSLDTVQCESGNCTFPQFSTIGVCNSCLDASNLVKNGTAGPGVNLTIPGSVGTCTNTGNNNCSAIPVRWVGDGKILATSVTSPNQASIMMLTTLTINSQMNNDDLDVSTFSCSLSPYVRTYNASVSNTVLTETLLSSVWMGVNQLFFVDQCPDIYRLATRQTLRNGRWENCTTSATAGPGFIEVDTSNIDNAPQQDPPDSNQTVYRQYFPEDCVWQFGYQTMLGLRGEFIDTLDNLEAYLGETLPIGTIIARNVYDAGINLSSMK